MSIQTVKQSSSMLGIILMALAMLSIPLVDGVAKYLSASYSPLYISWVRYAVAASIVLPISFLVHGRRVFPQEELGAHTLRTIFLVTSMTLYFLAIARVPLATALSAYFIGPIIATVLSVVLLGEILTVRKVASLVLGFAGTLIILQPGAELQPGILLAMGAGAFFALYMVATRKASRHSPPLKTLAFQCCVGTVLLFPQALWTWSVPDLGILYLFFALGLLSTISHILSIMAFRYADASTLSPLVYLELIAASLIGYFFFGDVPGAPIVIGAAAIILGGLLLLRPARAV